MDGDGETTVNAASVRMSYVDIKETEEITNVDGVQLDATPRGEIYDLTGRRISSPSKGMYIVNGKKFIK